MEDFNFTQRMNTTSNSDLIQKVSELGLKQSMVLTKGTNPGLSFTNGSTHNFGSRKNLMSQSCIKKQSIDMDNFIKQVKEKFNSIFKTLSQHDEQLNNLKEKPNNNSFLSSNDSFFRNESFNTQLLRSVRKQFEEDSYKLRSNIYSQIDSLKAQLRNECIKKTQLQFMFGKFENNISDLVQNNTLSKQFNDMKYKLKADIENIQLKLNQDLNNKVKQIHDTSSKHFLELTHYVDLIKSTVQSMKQQSKPTFFTSNQKCYSPKLIKYKQSMQRLKINSYDKPSQQITVGEITYYIDKDGYLLDSNFYYLLDKNNKQIQLQSKQMNILNSYDILK